MPAMSPNGPVAARETHVVPFHSHVRPLLPRSTHTLRFSSYARRTPNCAGRACGAINPGVHERVPDGNISMAHVTLLRALGITTPSYGFNGGETSDALGSILAV